MNREDIQREALSEAIKHKRCGLAISMGVGKTRIAIQHIIKNYEPLRTYLIVVPKNAVIESWKDEMTKMNLDIEIYGHIEFVNYRSLNKCTIPNKYEVVYLDECHNLLPSHEEFFKNYDYKILGLTGTPPTNKGSEKYNMVQKYCPIVYRFSVDEATDNNILNDYQIVVHKLRLSGIPNFQKKNKKGGYWYTSEIKDYEYCNSRYNQAVTSKQQQFAAIMRMRALMDYKTKESYIKSMLKVAKNKTIIFANTQDQADRVCDYSYHSKNKNSDYNLELFSDGRINQLSCVLQLSEGISIPNLRQGIIMHAYGNERKTAQRIGRLLRLSPDQKATCHILCYENTVDEKWVDKALESFDSNKIKYYTP